MRLQPTLVLTALLAIPACNNSGGGSAPPEPQGAPFVLAVGVDAIAPATLDRVTQQVDLSRLDITSVERVYELTTPAGTPFSFDLLTREERNTGWADMAIAHLLDGPLVPIGGSETLAAAGLVIGGTGLLSDPPWLSTNGDGFARLTISGSIQRKQIFAVKIHSPTGISFRLVSIDIGPASAINSNASTRGDHPGIATETTLYSSDSWAFGIPTIAVSGDRTSVVAYEGEANTWESDTRYEMRLQHDAATDAVTGGGSVDAGFDRGHWRDHEIAGLHNVLAVARCGAGAVELELSFDRGATFGQVEQFAVGHQSTRLVQVAMALDYSLALVYSRDDATATGPELVLVEGRAVAFDVTGSPTLFEFDQPQVLYRSTLDATPLLLGLAWSEGGDLVVGYAYTRMERGPDFTWTSTTDFRCAIRLWGGEFSDQRIDRDVLVGRDPSVAVLGQGDQMRVFYAYEGPQGIRLRSSDDAGATWSSPEVVGTAGAHTPAVFARTFGDETRVDLLFMSNGDFGTELHASRWSDFGTTPREDYRLTRSTMIESASAPGDLASQVGPPQYGFRLTQVSWFGYDAVLDGDQIVVVFDRETFDGVAVCLGAPRLLPSLPGTLSAPGFAPSVPPPLAPGMTLPIDPPDPQHRHQLKLIRID